MAPIPGPSSFATFMLNGDTGQAKAPPRTDNKGRKFFQQMQPTFSVDVSGSISTLEFLDNFDPTKGAVVRKKAREWVNKNREISSLRGPATLKTRSKNAMSRTGDDQKKQLTKWKPPVSAAFSPQVVGANTVDPFGVFPNIGRDFGHIMKYFLSPKCPEGIPCSDDKYADQTKHAVVPFQHENTILGSMAKSKLTFVLWLYATVVIRDGILGSFDTEELFWFYNKSLRMVQETIDKETVDGQFSDHLIKAVACMTASAVFSGMFDAAIRHRDALVHLLTLRGGGDLLAGWQSTCFFTRKASQWCELLVAAQLAEIPQLPRQSYSFSPLPEQIAIETEALTARTMESLPPVSDPFVQIVRYLHQIALSYSSPPPDVKIDDFLIQPMYDGEHTILRVLAAQKESGHSFTEAEVLLAESFQLYFYTGPRDLPPQTRLCELFISRVMKALLPLQLEASSELLHEAAPTIATFMDARNHKMNAMPEAVDHFYQFLRHPRKVNNVITWALALGTMVTAPLLAPEHSWFKQHFRLQLRAMALHRSEKHWFDFLDLFPTTDGFTNHWINLRSVWRDHGV